MIEPNHCQAFQDGDTLEEIIKIRIKRIIRKRQFWWGLFFFAHLLALPAAITAMREGYRFFIADIAVMTLFGMIVMLAFNFRISILDEGRFKWTNDVSKGISLRGRWSSSAVYGENGMRYAVQQLIFRFTAGTPFIGIDYMPEELPLGKKLLLLNTLIAYKL